MNDSSSNGNDSSEIDKIVQDAKELYERLIVDEETANELLCKANFINNSAVTMLEYQDIIEKLEQDNNDDTTQVSSIVTESQQLNRLRNENAQLKVALEDHQFALELIMSKYRQQVCKFLNYHSNQKIPTVKSSCDSSTVLNLSSQIKEMAQLMMDSIENDENNQMARDKIISQLTIENETLRELVKIALEFQSIKKEDVPSDILVNIR
ncbi:FGFR1 oncogene partner 2 homolog [Panonychus citri]|uniref:FGFR1 oncogene partner 2 homolog n=1 Tax=Panonychus citri TaxID=50023 RepID=UPI0023079ED2|nr:FGFR1 oncogene partner 2 homolog [Panonychus citri]